MDKGKVYFEFDWLPQAPGADAVGITTLYNPRLIVGLGHDVEAGLNFPIYHYDASPSTYAYIQPDLKWKFFKNDDKGLALAAGFVVNTPLNEGDGQGTWSYIYGNFSKKWKDGPRITFGGYGVVRDQDSGNTTFVGTPGGVLLGYEQPLGKSPVSFVADWFSGKNTIGYFTPGISVALPHSGLLNIGYSIGNDVGDETPDYKNRYVFIYYGVTF